MGTSIVTKETARNEVKITSRHATTSFQSNYSVFVIWLTGLPSSGKTTIASALKPKLDKLGIRSQILDGDVMRKELSPNLGFTRQDRYEHVKKVIYICKILSNNGIVSIVSIVSPDKEIRAYVRNQLGNLLEVYVKCSLETCIKRDCKGLYRKALNGEMTNLIGLQDPYEEPFNPEVIAETEHQSPDDITDNIILKIKEYKRGSEK
jgi:adenylylsulfate kinase